MKGEVMEFIRFKDVEKTYSNGVNAVYDMNLEIKKGEFVAIVRDYDKNKRIATIEVKNKIIANHK